MPASKPNTKKVAASAKTTAKTIAKPKTKATAKPAKKVPTYPIDLGTSGKAPGTKLKYVYMVEVETKGRGGTSTELISIFASRIDANNCVIGLLEEQMEEEANDEGLGLHDGLGKNKLASWWHGATSASVKKVELGKAAGKAVEKATGKAARVYEPKEYDDEEASEDNYGSHW